MSIFVRSALGLLMLSYATNAYAQTSPAQTIRIGETVRGVIEAREKEANERGWLVDFFDFNASRGETVTITLKSTSFDAFLDVHKGDAHLEEDDDAGGGPDSTDAKVVLEPAESGVHRIYVTSVGNKSTGAYTLMLERGGQVTIPAQTSVPREARLTPPPTPIRLGQTVQGRMSPLSPLHTDDTPYMPYSFTGRRGQHVIIEMKASDFDAYIVLMKAGEDSEIDTDDDGGEGTDARLFFTLPSDGAYEVRANSISKDSAGAFSLSLAESATPPPPEVERVERTSRSARRPIAAPSRSVPLAVGDTMRGTLQASDLKGDEDIPFDAYRIRGQARQKVIISMSSDAFDAKLILLDAVGNQLADNDDDNGSDPAITYTLPANGDYYVLATGLSAGDSGAYTVTLSREKTAP